MTAWYYQCSAAQDAAGYSYEDDFRQDVVEWRDVVWPGLGPQYNKIRTITPGARPLMGDPVVVGFAKTGAKRPGIVAVGIVVDEREESRFTWRPTPPTGVLLVRPLWDADIEQRLKAVRGGMKSLTCWEMTAADEDYLLARVARWAGTGA